MPGETQPGFSGPATGAGGPKPGSAEWLAQKRAQAGGTVLGPAMVTTPLDQLKEALSAVAESMMPNSGFLYGEDELPHWFPAPLREVLGENPELLSVIQGNYDPYMGSTSADGDEMVYFGDEIDPSFVGDTIQDVFFSGTKSEKRKQKWKETGEDARADRNADMLGDPSEAAPDRSDKGKRERGTRPNALTYQQAMNLPYQWDDEQVQSVMKKMRQAGLQVTNFNELRQEWGGLVDRASKMYSLSGGQRKVTPWDVLELSKKEAISAGTFTDFESGSQTHVAKRVSEISEGASWQTLQATLSTLLGRDPTDEELREYTYRMNNLAAKNPSITETITRFKGGEAVASHSSTTGGFDAGDMAQEAYDEAQDDPDYGAYQAGTTYFNAAIQALGAIGDA